MIEPPVPENESDRILSLKNLEILDTLKEERFERITRIAQNIFSVPIVLVSLVDSHRQWFKSCVGLSVSEVPRSISFCGHAILKEQPFIINDALLDPRFCDNPLVVGEPFIRFYAGIPIHGPNAERIGSFCVIDSKPRQISKEEINTLKGLAVWVDRELNLTDTEFTNLRLEMALKGSKVGVWDWMDFNSNVEWWSEDFYSVLGYERNDLSPTLENFKQLLYPNDQKRTFELLDDHFKNSKPFDLEYRLKTKSQGYRWFHGRGVCVRDEQGKPVRMVGTIIDIHERKVLEKSLIDQKFALDQHAIVAVADKNMKIIYANDKFCELSKFSREELLGQDHVILNSGYHSKEFMKNLRGTISSGKVWKGEIKNKAKDGSFYWVDTTITPFLDDEGKPFQYIAIRKDITKRKQYELQLDEIRQRTNFAMLSAGIGIWEWNIQTNELIWDDQMFQLYGIQRSDFSNAYEAWEKGVHPEDKERSVKELQMGVSGEKEFNTEFRVKWPDGSIRYIKAFGLVLRDQDRKVLKMVGVNWDITESKRLNAELRQSMEKYQGLFNSMDEGFCIIEMIFDKNQNPIDWRYLETNPAFIHQTGLSDVIGKRISEVIPNIESYWVELFGKISITGQAVRYENYVQQLSRWYDVYAFNYGEIKDRCVAILFNDITEKKRSATEILKKSEELERSNKELEQFAYVASHDLQEPLRMVASFTQLLERKYKDKLDDQAKEYIHFAVDGATRMQGLIDDLLMFSKSGQKDVPIISVDLNVVCNRVLKDLEELLKENKATVQMGELPVVLANDTQMNQLFLNLIGNAIKYKSDRDPIVKVEAKRNDKEQWQFSVSDNGIGIEEQYFNKLFIIFHRLHTKKAYKGTGIGLALCKKIVDNYYGRIWVESRFGEGATFHFTLNQRGKA